MISFLQTHGGKGLERCILHDLELKNEISILFSWGTWKIYTKKHHLRTLKTNTPSRYYCSL